MVVWATTVEVAAGMMSVEDVLALAAQRTPKKKKKKKQAQRKAPAHPPGFGPAGGQSADIDLAGSAASLAESFVRLIADGTCLPYPRSASSSRCFSSSCSCCRAG